MSPRPDVSEQRKSQILEAASRLFARLGIHKTSMDSLAAEAGVSKGILYWYFTSKDAIITALLEQIFSGSLRDLRAQLQAPGSVRDRLLQLTAGVAAEFERIVPLLPVAFEFYAMAYRNAAVRSFLKTYYQAYCQDLASLISQGITSGEFRAVDAEQVAWSIAALYEGHGLFWMLDPAHVIWHDRAQASLELLLAGLVAE
jgi:AcrR family transcriptional regulator